MERAGSSCCSPSHDGWRRHGSAQKFANCRNIGQLSDARLCASSTLCVDIRLHCMKAPPRLPSVGRRGSTRCRGSEAPQIIGHGSRQGLLMLRIERSTNGHVVYTLSGRIQTDDIEHFQQLLVAETPGRQLVFDLRDVTLVNQDAVTFLAGCEANGAKIENCPLHIRNWIDQDKCRKKRRRKSKVDTP